MKLRVTKEKRRRKKKKRRKGEGVMKVPFHGDTFVLAAGYSGHPKMKSTV